MKSTSVEKKVGCRSCGEAGAVHVTGEMLRCLACDIVFSAHSLDLGIYEDPDKVRDWELRAGTPMARRIALFRLGLLAMHLRTGSRILDYGSGTGDFVAQANQCGYEAVGFDVSARMGTMARRNLVENFGLPARLIRDRLPLGTWDAVTLWDVVEHLESPWETLAQLSELLVPGGLLALLTPDLAAAGGMPLEEWRHYKPREHLWLFTERTLGELLTRCGFRILTRGRDESWARSDNDRMNLLHVVARKEIP